MSNQPLVQELIAIGRSIRATCKTAEREGTTSAEGCLDRTGWPRTNPREPQSSRGFSHSAAVRPVDALEGDQVIAREVQHVRAGHVQRLFLGVREALARSPATLGIGADLGAHGSAFLVGEVGCLGGCPSEPPDIGARVLGEHLDESPVDPAFEGNVTSDLLDLGDELGVDAGALFYGHVPDGTSWYQLGQGPL